MQVDRFTELSGTCRSKICRIVMRPCWRSWLKGHRFFTMRCIRCSHFAMKMLCIFAFVAVVILIKSKTNRDNEKRRVKIAYFIALRGSEDLRTLKPIFKNLWHEDNIYLIHVDEKATSHERDKMQRFVSEQKRKNIKILDDSLLVSWGRFSMLLMTLHGLSSALLMDKEWEYWINLSAADMPLFSQEDIRDLLTAASEMNKSSFIGGSFPDWKMLNKDRRTTYLDDEGVFLKKSKEVIDILRYPHVLMGVRRENPDLFRVYKGELWVILHRSLAEYIHHSPDNLARTLLMYFAASYISDELFFQTLVCHPKFPVDFHITPNHLRFIQWAVKSRGHPAVIDDSLIDDAVNSGAMFARKFDHHSNAGTLEKLEKWIGFRDGADERKKRVLETILQNQNSTFC